MEVAITGEEAWLRLKHPGRRRRLQRKMKGAVCSCLQLSGEVGNGFAVLQQEAWGADLGKGKQKGEAEQKSHATSTQCFPPFWANLLFEQQPKSQVLWMVFYKALPTSQHPSAAKFSASFHRCNFIKAPSHDPLCPLCLPCSHGHSYTSYTILPLHFPSVLPLHDKHYGWEFMRM